MRCTGPKSPSLLFCAAALSGAFFRLWHFFVTIQPQSLPPPPKPDQRLLDFNLLDVDSINSPQAHKAQLQLPQHRVIASEQALDISLAFFVFSAPTHTCGPPSYISIFSSFHSSKSIKMFSRGLRVASRRVAMAAPLARPTLAPASSLPSHPSRPSDHITKRSWTTMRDRATSAP